MLQQRAHEKTFVFSHALHFSELCFSKVPSNLSLHKLPAKLAHNFPHLPPHTARFSPAASPEELIIVIVQIDLCLFFEVFLLILLCDSSVPLGDPVKDHGVHLRSIVTAVLVMI